MEIWSLGVAKKTTTDVAKEQGKGTGVRGSGEAQTRKRVVPPARFKVTSRNIFAWVLLLASLKASVTTGGLEVLLYCRS
ncbi:hypothetical protein M440DRAFT_1403531 [Trichoderma longibrachiatum ATCC 18648]|uniref:Uncharacterized protein n=1 Tax=Trichoderma longibrachiatum ATCC 18648 TaxID=983965 RepID=A0A2T4BXX4_TRILO|nr:hypothetical protein M440DRAFT_1403531 [Trichoderma longibrachiatum ATCC 18648]